jgi:hypothetical protein
MYLQLLAEYVGSECNAFDLNSGDVRFKCRRGHRQRVFRVFSQPLPANAAIVSQIRPRLLASSSFPHHYSCYLFIISSSVYSF